MKQNVVSHQELIEQVIAEIEQCGPRSVVYCTASAVPAIDRLQQHGLRVSKANTFSELETLPLFDLGLVFDFLEHKNGSDGAQFLCRLRNFNCRHVWVAVAAKSQWSLTTMIGFGFRRIKCFSAQDREVCSYRYRLDSYNPKREWNSPKGWANPQNWGKYRW